MFVIVICGWAWLLSFGVGEKGKLWDHGVRVVRIWVGFLILMPIFDLNLGTLSLAFFGGAFDVDEMSEALQLGWVYWTLCTSIMVSVAYSMKVWIPWWFWEDHGNLDVSTWLFLLLVSARLCYYASEIPISIKMKNLSDLLECILVQGVYSIGSSLPCHLALLCGPEGAQWMVHWVLEVATLCVLCLFLAKLLSQWRSASLISLVEANFVFR